MCESENIYSIEDWYYVQDDPFKVVSLTADTLTGILQNILLRKIITFNDAFLNLAKNQCINYQLINNI